MDVRAKTPRALAERIWFLPYDAQAAALTACADCREHHGGWCIVDMCDGAGRCAAEDALPASFFSRDD